MKKINKEDAPTNATGSAVVGTGDDKTVWKKKKKKKLKGTTYVGAKPDSELVLKREDVDSVPAPVDSIPVPTPTPDSTFAQMPVFKVSQDDFLKCQDVKKRYARWNKHIDIDSDYGKKIHTYAKRNPKKSIIVQDDKTGHMVYLKKYSQVEKEK